MGNRYVTIAYTPTIKTDSTKVTLLMDNQDPNLKPADKDKTLYNTLTGYRASIQTYQDKDVIITVTSGHEIRGFRGAEPKHDGNVYFLSYGDYNIK